MKKGLQRFLAVIMVVLMTSVYLPISDVDSIFSVQASAYSYDGSLGGQVKWNYDSKTKTLTVTGSGNMKDYTKTPDDFTKYRALMVSYIYKHAQKIVIGEGITSVGNFAFNSFAKVRSVTLPSTLTRIGKDAFSGQTSLGSVVLPASLATIDTNAFNNTAITKVNIPYTVKTFGTNAFPNNCKVVCNYGDVAYNKTNKANVELRQPSLYAEFVQKNATQITMNLYLNDASGMNAGNFKAVYNSDITPVSTDVFYGEEDGFTKAIVFDSANNTVNIAIAAPTEVAYSACTGKCAVKLASIDFNLKTGTHVARVDLSASTLMLLNSKRNVTPFVAEFGEHTWTPNGAVVAPGCNSYGYTPEKCSVCGEERELDIKNALGHEYGAPVVVEPKCEEDGYTSETCSRCGDVQKYDYVDAVGHSIDERDVASTCKTLGYTMMYCKVCGLESNKVDKESLDPNNHVNTEIRGAKTADCKNEGYTGDTWCNDCNKELSKGTKIEKTTVHKYNDVVTPPTCKDKGYTTHTCSVCGDVKVDTYTDVTTVHDYDAVVTPSTCKDKGFTTYTCKVCGDVKTDNYTDLASHDYKATVTPPTCEEDGYTTYVCSVCSHSYKDNETPASHKYEKNVTEATCTQSGFTTFECTACGHSYKGEFTAALGHDFDDDGVCTRCGAADENSKLAFNDENIFVINEETKTVLIKKTITSAELAAAITSKGWTVTAADGTPLDATKAVATKCLIKSENGEVYTIAILGDVNCDGKSNAADARITLRISARLEATDDIINLAADCDGKAKVSAADARVILRVSAKLQTF